MSAGGEGTIGAGTSESAAAAGCSLSERFSNNSSSSGRPSSHYQKHNIFARRALPDLEGLAVFTWGRGEDGQLGLGDTSDQDEPTYVDALRGVGVRQIACGSGHTVVLTTDGEVYTWVSDIIYYLPLLFEVRGGNEFTIVSKLWDLFWFDQGRGDDGRLGHGDNGWKYVPRITQSLAGQVVSQVTCGSYHTAAVTGNGDLYTW